MKKDNRFTVRGRVVTKEDQKGVLGLRVVIFDRDHLFDDQLGSTISNDEGDFMLQYREKDFRDLFERAPDLYIKILDCRGDLVHSSEDAVVWEAGQITEFGIKIPRARLKHHLDHARPLPRLSGGVVAREKLNVVDRAISLLDARGEISTMTPLGSRLFGPGGRGPVPRGAAYCPAPDILFFEELLEIAWGVIDNDPRAIMEFVGILDTLIHRHKVRQPQQFAAAGERWRTDSDPDTEALRKLLNTKKGLLGAGPSETLIEKERYLPLIMAAILAARGDRNVENRYLGILLGELGALGQIDVVYRGAKNALRSNPGGIGAFRDLLGYIGRTCGPDDGPIPWPIDPDDILDEDDISKMEKWAVTAEAARALRPMFAEYEIHDVDWGDGCPGSPVVITGENFLGMWPEDHRVRFANRSGWGTVEAAPEDYETDWTDTQIEVLVPEEAGPGSISLSILDRIDIVGDMVHWVYRRGRGATFNFKGGAAHINVFAATGRGHGTVRVDAGETVNVRWVVVPGNADTDLEISQDGVVESHNDLDVEGSLDIDIPAGCPSVTTCTLTADNPCPQAADQRDLRLNAYIDPELAVAGIEVTQAIQHFNITGDQADNNTVRLAQGKHTMVRVYVDSGRSDGFDAGAGPNIQPDVTGQLTVTDLDTGASEILTPINPTGTTQGRPAADIDRDEIEHSLNFQLPLHRVTGRKELRVSIESESPYGDRYTAEDDVEVTFHRMGDIRLIRILCTDNNTTNSPTVAGWDVGREGARTRYPLAHDGFPVFIAPGNLAVSTNEMLSTPGPNHPGWDNLLDDLEDIADDYHDGHLYVWCMVVPDDATYDINGIGTSGGHPRLICKENLPATFAHELGHTQGSRHSQCPAAGARRAPDPATVDNVNLPGDGLHHDTGICVYTYRCYPASTAASGDIMSYCGGQDRWPSVEFWDIIFDLHD